MDVFNVPEPLRERLRAELRPGESVFWAGQPAPGRFMRRGFLMWLFFIPWTAFALFWIGAAAGFSRMTRDGVLDWFPLFGIPFLLIGLGGLCTPFWLRRKAGLTVYALTSQRALAIEGARTVTVKSYALADLGVVERKEYRDGLGDLVLRKSTYSDSDGDQCIRKEGFFAISHARRVEDLIADLVRRQAS